MEAITWPVALSIVGTFIVLMTFINAQIRSRKEKPWDDDLQQNTTKLSNRLREIEHRVTVVEGKLDALGRTVETIKEDQRIHQNTTSNMVEKVEGKLEKVTDITIDILQDVSSIKRD